LKYKLAFLLVLLALSGSSAGSEWSLDAIKERRIDALFQEWNRPDSPGTAVGIVRRGELLFSRGYGSANLDHGVRLEADSVLYIASTSKQFAAASIALLAIDEVLSIDDDVRKWIPELPVYEKTITIRHLIHHTSGLRDYLSLMGMQGKSFEDYFDNKDAIRLLSLQKGVNFLPGERYLYSNSNYVLLAEIANRASGMSSQDFSEKRVFGPLGMGDTRWGTGPSRILEGRVTSYQKPEDGESYRRFVHNFAGHGDGNLWTSVSDLARWDGNFYEPKVGGQAFIDLVLTRGQLNDGSELDYAFGLGHGEHKGHATVSHGGAFLGFRSQLLRFPDEGLSIIVLANLASINPTELAEQVADVVLDLEDVEDPPEIDTRIHIPDEVLETYIGEYYEAESGRVLEIALQEGRLALKGSGDPIPLYHRSVTHFGNRARKLEVRFEVPTLVIESSTTVEPARAERLRRLELDVGALEELTGRFWSEELSTAWETSVAGSKLRIGNEGATPTFPASFPIDMEPLDHDRFHGRFFAVVFERGERGRITGFRVYSPRASGMVFERVGDTKP
jgi:CubicO group peptidase (beta-lactamase class C family)